MSEAQPRTSEGYEVGGSSKWEDWARLEGKNVVAAAMVKYIGEHPEIAKKGQEDALDQKRDEIAREEAKKAGLDVSSSDASGEPKWDEDRTEPQAA